MSGCKDLPERDEAVRGRARAEAELLRAKAALAMIALGFE